MSSDRNNIIFSFDNNEPFKFEKVIISDVNESTFHFKAYMPNDSWAGLGDFIEDTWDIKDLPIFEKYHALNSKCLVFF